jgi:signal transduction histidine kinase
VDARPLDHLRGELEEFAAEVAHELRTPLAALSGEVELALRRERSPAAYREALSRAAVSIAELVDLTADLATLGQTSDAKDTLGRRARLDVMFAHVAGRCGAAADDAVVVESATTDVAVAGDEALLMRALTLVVEHAVRYRRDGARVRLRAASLEDHHLRLGAIDLVVDAAPAGFWPNAWRFLVAPGDSDHGPRPVSGPLRLRSAERIVRDCGGSLRVATIDGLQVVHIRLQCAEVV